MGSMPFLPSPSYVFVFAGCPLKVESSHRTWCYHSKRATCEFSSRASAADSVASPDRILIAKTPLQLPPTGCILVKLGSVVLPPLVEHALFVVETQDGSVHAFDFVPRNPADLQVTASLILGGAVQGEYREKTFSSMPFQKAHFVCNSSRTLPEIREYSRNYQAEVGDKLSLLRYDCRSYVDALVLFATGVKRSILQADLELV
eukprot:EC124692.1.p1 GENE.EC124692.1~~EC124692.1.p1  ORF type:complete len:203 (+),score=5.52 EC124692.1:59-667(+)